MCPGSTKVWFGQSCPDYHHYSLEFVVTLLCLSVDKQGLFIQMQQNIAQQEYFSEEGKQVLQLKEDIVALLEHVLHTSHP